MSERDEDDHDAVAELTRVRELILARRNRFMAAALASIGMAGGCGATSRVCLSLARDEDAAAEDDGSVRDDGSVGDDAGTDAGIEDAGPGATTPDASDEHDAGPALCLTPI